MREIQQQRLFALGQVDSDTKIVMDEVVRIRKGSNGKKPIEQGRGDEEKVELI